MPQAPRPVPRSPVQEREATCLETDEEMMATLRGGLLPPPAAPALGAAARPLGVPRTASAAANQPAIATQSSVTIYRPTMRPPIAVLTVCDDGRSDGEQFRLRDGHFTIGRTDGDLVIPHDGLISSRHVEITRQNVGGQQRWVITDLQSTNGLFVRISRTLLADQSELLVGKGRYRLIAPTNDGLATADYVPPENARNTTQAWGSDGATPAIPALVELVGNGFGNRVLLLGQEYWIGTDSTCAICRGNDPYCDARHARVWRDAKGRWQAEHDKAVNGLWFRVPQVVCENVVQFQIGEQRFRLRAGG